MTHEGCIERLSAHLDGDLPTGEALDVRDHLAGCPGCAGVLDDLRGLVVRARALTDLPPRRDLWPAVARATGGPGAGALDAPPIAPPRPGTGRPAPRLRRRLSFSIPQLAAAGLALALASGGAAWVARPLPPPAAPAASGTQGGEPFAAAAGLPGERRWAAEVARLEEALAGADGLDAATVRVLERSLLIIDRAIRESGEALAADPGNPFLEEHLVRSWERKLATLREASELATWTRS